MVSYFCDGSLKGLTIGIGVTKVDECGFIETYSEHFLNKAPTSLLAEACALMKAVQLALENEDKKVYFYVDNLALISNIKEEIFHGKENDYVFLFFKKLKEKLFLLEKKGVEYFLERFDENDEEHIMFTNISHSISRKYLKDTSPIFTRYQAYLRRTNKKRQINYWSTKLNKTSDDFVIKIILEKKEKKWICRLENDVEHISQHKRPVVALFLAVKKIKKIEKDSIVAISKEDWLVIEDVPRDAGEQILNKKYFLENMIKNKKIQFK